MIVVGDASIFIALERIGAQHLLPKLYGEIHVPDVVWFEIFSTEEGNSTPPAWIVRHSLSRFFPLAVWPEHLDAGETEAIHLARELAADLLLIDESAGRIVARRLGLAVSGVVGLLIEAKRRGEITLVKPLLYRLRETGFWLSDRVLKEALARVGEHTHE